MVTVRDDKGPIDGVSLDAFVRARSRMEHAPRESSAVVASLSLAGLDAWRSVERKWLGRAEANPHLASVIELLHEDLLSAMQGGNDIDASEPSAQQAGSTTAAASGGPARELPSFMLDEAMPTAAQPPSLVTMTPSAQPPSTRIAPLPTSPIAVPARSQPFTASTEPIDLDRLRRIVLADPTPFLGKTTPARLAEIKAEAAASEALIRPGPPTAAAEVDVDETAMFAPSAAERAKLQTLPFTHAAKGPELTVEQYAAMSAELEAKGPLPAILTRYGVTDASLMLALHVEQNRRFEADPSLRARFEQLKAHYLSFMQPLPRT